MPNWCSTSVTFHGDTNESLNKFTNLIQKAGEVEKTDWFKDNVDFHGLWLGSLALAMGYAVDDNALYEGSSGLTISQKKDQHTIERCRGTIYFNDEAPVNNEFTADIESAWAPPEELLDAICEYCGVTCEWIASEPGCCIFINTNPSVYEEIFVLDTEDDIHYLSSEQALLDLVSQKFDIKVASVEELADYIENDIDGKCEYWCLDAYSDRNGTPWYIIDRTRKDNDNE